MMRYHVNRHHAKECIKCPSPLCHRFFKTVEDQDEHVSKVHNKNQKGFYCVLCKTFLMDHKSLWSHMKTHKNVIRCSYNYCLMYFKTIVEQKLHMKQVHEQGDNKKVCGYCGLWFSKNGFATHVRKKHAKVAIKCTKFNCSSYFKTKTERQEHILKVHMVERRKKKITCIYCGKIYPVKSFVSHIKDQHSKKMIRCSYLRCISYFHTKAELSKHIKEMHKEAEKQKTLHCAHCSYKSYRKTMIIQHFNQMHGSEKLKCILCPINASRYYKSRPALKCHVKKAHNNRNNKNCPYCKKRFTSIAINNHVQSDMCKFCDKKLLCTGLMQIHLKKCKRGKVKSSTQ